MVTSLDDVGLSQCSIQKNNTKYPSKDHVYQNQRIQLAFEDER